MKDNRCFICKYLQLETAKAGDDLIYDTNGNITRIPLCYTHSVELFKAGQKVFLLRYRYIFQGSYGSDSDTELLEHFAKKVSSY